MFLTKRAKENPKLKYTSLSHLLTEDFLSECLGELKKDKAIGIDGVRVEEYEKSTKRQTSRIWLRG